MSVDVRTDSVYTFADAYFDDVQGEYVWGIYDLPDPKNRDDDQFYEVRTDDERLDLIAYKFLGDSRLMHIIMHYNNIPNALDLSKFKGKTLRIPSRRTVEKVYLNVVS